MVRTVAVMVIGLLLGACGDDTGGGAGSGGAGGGATSSAASGGGGTSPDGNPAAACIDQISAYNGLVQELGCGDLIGADAGPTICRVSAGCEAEALVHFECRRDATTAEMCACEGGAGGAGEGGGGDLVCDRSACEEATSAFEACEAAAGG